MQELLRTRSEYTGIPESTLAPAPQTSVDRLQAFIKKRDEYTGIPTPAPAPAAQSSYEKMQELIRTRSEYIGIPESTPVQQAADYAARLRTKIATLSQADQSYIRMQVFMLQRDDIAGFGLNPDNLANFTRVTGMDYNSEFVSQANTL
jgi:hypothetical protein